MKYTYPIMGVGTIVVLVVFVAALQYSNSLQIPNNDILDSQIPIKDIKQTQQIIPNEPSQDIEEGVRITNGIKHLVSLDKIVGGGPPKDGIPSIDNPKFIPASEDMFFLTMKWLLD